MRSILERISDGDGTAIDACLREYGDLVWRLASRYLDRAPGEVEDAVQEVFVELWLNAGKFDATRGGEAAFVATIAHRRLTDYQRRLTVRRRVGRPTDPRDLAAHINETSSAGGAGAKEGRNSDGGALDGASGASADRLAGALDALRGLPEDERHALGLWLYRGLTHRQISEATDAPIGTIKSRLRRGLSRLREGVAGLSVGAGTPRAEGGTA